MFLLLCVVQTRALDLLMFFVMVPEPFTSQLRLELGHHHRHHCHHHHHQHRHHHHHYHDNSILWWNQSLSPANLGWNSVIIIVIIVIISIVIIIIIMITQSCDVLRDGTRAFHQPTYVWTQSLSSSSSSSSSSLYCITDVYHFRCSLNSRIMNADILGFVAVIDF